jgi:HAD superfamily hydrolase (TIGR01509 family)
VVSTKAFLFDFDGVLADTEPLHWKAWREVLAPYSPDLDWETYLRLCVGTSDVQMLQFFSEITRKPVTVDELRALYPKKRKIFEALAEAQPIVDADLVRLLAGLKGLLLGVVTSSNQVEVEPILRRAGLLDLLGTVIYGNDVAHHKPHPEPYQTALGRLGVGPSEATVFEDSASGIRSATEAGCHVVTVDAPADLPSLVTTELTRNQV